MSRYLIVAHQTVASSELREKIRALLAADTAAEFGLLVPAAPVQHRLTWEDFETLEAARARLSAGRAMLEELGAPILSASIGGRVPVPAIADELRVRPGYDEIIVMTLPAGVSTWLRLDLPHQARRFGLPVTHIIARSAPSDVPAVAPAPVSARADDQGPIDALAARLGSRDFAERRHAREALVERAPASLPLLTAALTDGNSDVRWEAARALVDLAAPSTAAPLVLALEDDDGSVRWLAAEALVNIGAPALRPLLLRLLVHSESAWLRDGAHHVLSHAPTGVAGATGGIVRALEAIDPAVGVLPEVDRALRHLEGLAPVAAR